ncbi:MAG: SRPBCC family protein [Paracoccaceae bacterium]
MKLSMFIAASVLTAVIYTPLSAETACDATLMQGSIAQLTDTHATVQTSVLIDATPAAVWATLTDFDAMVRWSSGTFQGMTGEIKDGGSVTVTFIFGTTEDGELNVMTIPHTLIYEEGSVIGWSDPFPEDIGGGHDNHLYRVEACGEQTLFVQSDEVVGNPYAANFVSQLLPMYQTFNAELKAEVEGQS